MNATRFRIATPRGLSQNLLLGALITILIGRTGQADTGTIVGGSLLLSPTNLGQLETWLGEGPLTLSNIFTKTLGDGKTAMDFHASANGRGRTFTIMEVLASQGNTRQTIGGYDPQSWDSSSTYHITMNDPQRTGFIFNLTASDVRHQKTSLDPLSANGQYQTYNSPSYGPTYGGGHDIYIQSDLSAGYANQYTYGSGATPGALNIVGRTGLSSLDYGTLEVFTIGPYVAPSVPEPASIVLLGIGALTLLRRGEATAV